MCRYDVFCVGTETVCPTCTACPARLAEQEKNGREGAYAVPGFTSHSKWAHEHAFGKAKPNGELRC